MPHTRKLELTWQEDSRADRVRMLACMYLAGGLICLTSPWTNRTPRAPIEELICIGSAGVVIGLALLAFGRRLSAPALHGAVAAYSALICAVATISITTAGVVSLGPAVIVVALYAGYFCTRRAQRWHLLVAIVAYVLGTILSPAPAAHGSTLTIAVVALAVGISLNRLTLKLRREGATDALTGTVGRGTWLQVAELELQADRTEPLSVALIDLDNFKEVNDRQGHLAGDAVLQSAAQSWARALDRTSLVGRFGGDEFVVLLPGTSSTVAASTIENLRDVHPARWTSGVAQAEPGDRLTDLLARADIDLLRAKDIKRNATGTTESTTHLGPGPSLDRPVP